MSARAHGHHGAAAEERQPACVSVQAHGLHEDRQRPRATDKRVIDTITRRLAKPDAAKAFARPSVDVDGLRVEADALHTLIKQRRGGVQRRTDRRPLTATRELNAPRRKLAAINDKLLPVHMSADIRSSPETQRHQEFEKLPTLDRKRGVIDAVAVVTIHRQEKKGGRFDPRSISVVGKSRRARDIRSNCLYTQCTGAILQVSDTRLTRPAQGWPAGVAAPGGGSWRGFEPSGNDVTKLGSPAIPPAGAPNRYFMLEMILLARKRFRPDDPQPHDTEREAYIQATVDAMPPLRPEQIAELSALFDYEPPEGGDAA